MLLLSKIWFFSKYFVVLSFLSCGVKKFTFSTFKFDSSIFKFANSLNISKNLSNAISLDIRNTSLFPTSDSINGHNSNTLYSNDPLNVKSLKFYKNRYSFVPYNTFLFKNENKLPNYRKIQITPCNNNKPNIAFYSDSRYESSLYLFDSIRNWIGNTFSAWYVPPLPIGEKVSVRLKDLGPIQTEEESNAFLKQIGAVETDSIFDVVEKYRSALKKGNERQIFHLRDTCREFMRKFLIYQFEKDEEVASKGFKAWKEHWRPTKDEIEEDPNVLSKQDEQFISWWPDKDKITDYIKDLKKKRKKLNLIQTSRFKGLIRFSKDFKGRLYKCSKTMFPVMALGLIPELGPLSIGISTILASKIIYQGDPKEPDVNRDYTRYITSRGYDRSEAIKSIATMFIVTVHSMLGYFMSCMAIAHTKLASIIPSELINSFFINLQLILTALIYDTSEMTYDEKVKMSESGNKEFQITIEPGPYDDMF